MKSFTCEYCKKSFKSTSSLNKHIRNKVCLKRLMRYGKQQRKHDNENDRHSCDKCEKIFSSRRSLLRHQQRYHSSFELQFPCGYCNKFFADPRELDEHRHSQHSMKSEIYERSNVLKGSCRIFRYDILKKNVPINAIIPSAHEKISAFVKNLLIEMKSFKLTLVLSAEYEKIDHLQSGNDKAKHIAGSEQDNPPERMIMNFRSNTFLMVQSENPQDVVRHALYTMEINGENFNLNGSGWTLSSLLHIDLSVGRCHVLSGAASCNLHRIFHARNSRDAFAVKDDGTDVNADDIYSGRCFYHAVASYFLKEETNLDVLEQFIRSNFNEGDIPTPVKVTDVTKFESLNESLNIGINVITKAATGEVYPTFVSKVENPKHIINLLLFYIGQGAPKIRKKTNIEIPDHFYEEDEGQDEYNEKMDRLVASTVRHYALIDDLDREVSKARRYEQTTKSRKLRNRIQAELQAARRKNARVQVLDALRLKLERVKEHLAHLDEVYSVDTNPRRKSRVCYNCLNMFSTTVALERHKKWCFKEKPSIVLLPAPGDKMRFDPKRKNVYSRIQMFFDFECVQIKPKYPCSCRPEFHPKCQTSASEQIIFCKHGTTVEYEQIPFAYCLVVCSNEKKVLDMVHYVGMDASRHFLESILEMEKKYMGLLKMESKKMKFTEQDKIHFEETETCHICELDFLPGEKKVRDHGNLSMYVENVARIFYFVILQIIGRPTT